MTASQHEAMSRSVFEGQLAAAYPTVRDRVTRRYRDRQLAEEVSQDVLTEAFEFWSADPGYFNQRDLTAWSSQRASWRALDRLRERGKHESVPEGHTARPGHGEWREVTWACLQLLSEEDRKILEGRFYDGLTDQEVGDELYGPCGDSQANTLRVWRRRQRAYDRLRAILREHGIEGPADWAGQAV